ncbi:MAG: hypothetical protein H6839_12290 [Planctomycetes bacterium]|nr:hypothetical protein [Planctomycetota bacterium]
MYARADTGPRSPLTHKQLEQLREWLRVEYKGHLWHEVFAALVFAVFALIAHGVAFFFTAYVITYVSGGAILDADSMAVLVLPALVLLAMYPVYWWLYRTPVVDIALPSGPLRIRSKKMTPAPLFESADPAPESTLGMQMLLFPVWTVASCISHVAGAVHAARADTWVMARVLTLLYQHNRRMSVLDLDMSLREPNLPGALRALELEPGVLFYTENDLSLVLNDEVTQRIIEAAEIEAEG